VGRDRQAAERRRDGDGDAAQDRLHGESDRSTLPGERIADHGEQRGARHAGPRHDEGEPGEHERPSGRPPVEAVADRGQHDEEHERAATPVAIADPSAGVLIDAVEKVLARAEEANGRDRRAERLEILRDEPLPQIFAQRE
jgi:hypothetical protein